MKRRAQVFSFSQLPKMTLGKLALREFPKACLPKNVSVMTERLPPHVTLPPVMHRRTTELVICLKGVFSVVLDGKRVALRPGSCVFIPPTVWHVFQTGRAA